MRTHFHNEMSELQTAILRLGEKVCGNVTQAVEALRAGDQALAATIMRADRDIDRSEVRNEEACLKIIALHQPVADDLRHLVVMLKVNHELERISDLAVDIAESVHRLVPAVGAPWGERLAAMADETAKRLAQVLAALVHRDADVARMLWLADSDIDERTLELRNELREAIIGAQDNHASLLALYTAAGEMERLADHVKNIAKDVIYLVLGEIVRHRSQDFLDDKHSEPRKLRVLFVCIHNSARSQMAEAWMNHLYGDRFEAESAGLEPGELNPLAVEAMGDIGIDISQNTTRDVFDVVKAGARYDYLITVCDEAGAEKCPPVSGAVEEIHWSFPDPSAARGTREARLAVARSVRDDIRRRIDQWVIENQNDLGA